MKEIFNKLKDDKNLTRIIFIIGVIGILLIFVTSFFGESKAEEYSSDFNSVSEYGMYQEKRLKKIIEKLDGSGKTEVMLTMETSSEKVYSKEYPIKAIEPKVRGVVVICQGASDSEVKSSIMELVTKALNITADKVCITKGYV